MNLQRLFRPRRVAVYGGTWADYVAEQCRKLGYDGEIWRVHPKRDNCFKTTDDLPAAPDCAFLGINNELVIPEIDALNRRGAGGAVVFASGFGEVSDGADKASRLDEASAGMPFIGPNCYGFANLLDRVSLWPDQVGARPVDRGVAFVCQSGTVSITLMGQRRSLPVGYVITVGNQQRLSVADIIRFVANDERITAIGLYLEGIPDLGAFIEAVEYARLCGKPVVAVKVGKSAKAQATAFSHTGALTGSDRLMAHLFERTGVARCNNLASMVETLKLLHCHGPLPANRLAVMGASGGDMSMVSDIAEGFDIDFPLPQAAEVPELEASTGPGVRIDNPFDFHTYTWFDYGNMRRMFDAMLRSGYDLTAFMLDPPNEKLASTEDYDAVVGLLQESVNATGGKAALLSSLPDSLREDLREQCLARNVAPMQGLPEFLEAFHHSARIGKNWLHPQPLQLVGRGLAQDGGRVLTEAEGKAWLEQHGLNPPTGQVVAVEDAATTAQQIGFPVVLKAAAVDLAHKTDSNAVRLGLSNTEQVSHAASELASLSPRVLVESMVTDSVAELLLGITRDPQFGLNLTLGAGGIFTELHRDTTCLLPPITPDQVERALRTLRCYPLLTGWRGQPAADIPALVQAVVKLAEFAEAHVDQLIELDINPLLVRPEGQGTVVADTLIRIQETHHV